MSRKKITRALLSVFSKEGLADLVHALGKAGIEFVATGGTQQFIEKMGYTVVPAEQLTGYPSIFGGRVKTLHPAIFGGLLLRANHTQDAEEARQHAILPIDMIVVDLYPAEATIAAGKDREEVIEKIDIGGVSLIRAAAKNYQEVLAISSRHQYAEALQLIRTRDCATDLADRERFAALAFAVTAQYDKAIARYFMPSLSTSDHALPLRYGENPHQKGVFYGDLSALFDQLDENALSYNNLLDVDAAVRLVEEFDEEGPTFAIIKHTNACGVAQGSTVGEAYERALACDPVSAFGGVLSCNRPIDAEAARLIGALFFEAIVAPDYAPEALALLKAKKNRRILRKKGALPVIPQRKTALNGTLEQDIDRASGNAGVKLVTSRSPSGQEARALQFANRIVKHAKSNAIVLATERQMVGSGVGQTSRVDALRQAIEKAKRFGFDLAGVAMASDAFFPFPDCVEIAHREGIRAVIQPGGSIRDQESIDFCNQHDMAMTITGIRHFKH